MCWFVISVCIGFSVGPVRGTARSVFVLIAIARSLSRGDVTWHRPSSLPFVYQDVKKSQETPIMTIALHDKIYIYIFYGKCLIVRPQWYSTFRKPISGYQPQVGSPGVALITVAVRTLGNGQTQHIPVSCTTT